MGIYTRSLIAVVIVLFSFSTEAIAQKRKKKKKAETETPAPPIMVNELDSISYALGMGVAKIYILQD